MELEHESARGHQGLLAVGDAGRARPRFSWNLELMTAAAVTSIRHEARLQCLHMMQVCAAAGLMETKAVKDVKRAVKVKPHQQGFSAHSSSQQRPA